MNPLETRSIVPRSLVAVLGLGLIVGGSATLFAEDAHFKPYAARNNAVGEGAVSELSSPEVQRSIDNLQGFSMAFSAVSDAVRPSVVSIHVEKTLRQSANPMFGQGHPFENFFQVPEQERSVQGGGTGIIVSEDGYILTNNHVIDAADSITVRLGDGREFDATLQGTDPKTDLAVIHIPARGLSAATLGRSADARVGEWVVAIGNPYSLDFTVTAGIISAKGRTKLTNLVQYQDFIQTDASINPGNSGGPLVNLRGEVIGINTLIDGRGPGLGFAIPSDMASHIMDQLIASGHVTRPWLGVRIQDVDEAMAKAMGLHDADGAFVVSVEDGSPAQRKGLQAEDIIISIDGAPVPSSDALVNTIVGKDVGQNLTVEILRDGELRTLQITTAAMPERDAVATRAAPAVNEGGSALGLQVQPMTNELAQQLGGQPGEGLVVMQVDPSSPAGKAGLRRGDVILEANRMPTDSAEELREIAGAKGAEAILLKVLRGGSITYLAIELS